MLTDFFNEIEKESGEHILDICQPEDVTPVEELDDEDSKVIVFDDIKIDQKNMDRIEEYFSLARHRNCTCIYLCQSLYNVPKYIRRNTKCFCLYPGLDNRDVMNIASDHAQGVNKEVFKNIYNEATTEPYNFMCLDKTARHMPDKYRRNFDGLYVQ